jgi:Fibronectin type III domain/von Willebrand factor type A domain
VPTSRHGPRAQGALAVLFALVTLFGGRVPTVAAADPSDVVLVLDFSASILRDEANRNRFGAAVERIAARVDETAADLVAGDVTVSIVQFATKAADVSGCVDLKLLGSPQAVGRFADCLRTIATAYRRGPANALTTRIGTDTNYVAAMEQAARHLPADSIRPALVLFTDGRHDVAGVPVSRVQPARDRLFGSRSPFALLPVGLGLAAADREALGAGLQRLEIIKDMPACVSGATFTWPTVIFESADEAGAAVGVALQNATCTFTVAATPTPAPTPSPAPIRVPGVRLTAGDAKVEIAWSAPTVPDPISGYQARCRTGGGDWIESTDAGANGLKATVAGLANGAEYECEVAAVSAGTTSWTAAGTITPVGRPAAPAKPTVEPLNGAVKVSVAAPVGTVDRVRYECSSDGGATWSERIDTAATEPSAQIDSLINGTSYVCRAFATNTVGESEASPVSDAVRPCSGFLDCNQLFLPVVGGLAALTVLGLLLAFFVLYRNRVTGYVIAVVDVVHTANIGHGSELGLSLELDPQTRRMVGIVAAKGPAADVRIRHRRDGTFVIRDRVGRRDVADGEPVVIADAVGVRHTLVLRAFETNAASSVATRR